MESRVREQGGAWLDVRSAATHLSCSPKRIYDLVAERRVRFARDGRRLLFRVEWLDEMVVAQGPVPSGGEGSATEGPARW